MTQPRTACWHLLRSASLDFAGSVRRFLAEPHIIPVLLLVHAAAVAGESFDQFVVQLMHEARAESATINARLHLQGYRRPIQWEDEFALPHDLETNRVHPHFESEWRRLLAVAETTPKVGQDPQPEAVVSTALPICHPSSCTASLSASIPYAGYARLGSLCLHGS